MYVLGWDDCNLFQATNLFPGCLCAPFFVKFTLFFCKTWGSCTYYVITDRGVLSKRLQYYIGRGLECHIPILKNDSFENHLDSFPDC